MKTHKQKTLIENISKKTLIENIADYKKKDKQDKKKNFDRKHIKIETFCGKGKTSRKKQGSLIATDNETILFVCGYS